MLNKSINYKQKLYLQREPLRIWTLFHVGIEPTDRFDQTI
jgi:hypothetical protein